MKYKFFVLLLFYWGVSSAQNNASVISNRPQEKRWEIDKYVCSHSHYKTGKKDKPVLDFDAIDNWPTLNMKTLSISPDGKYIAYSIEKRKEATQGIDSLVMQATHNSWRQSFSGVSTGFFSSDSKLYIYQDKETLYFRQLGQSQPHYVKDVITYKRDGNYEWVAYQMNTKEIVLQNLVTRKEKQINNVVNFRFDNSNSYLICEVESKNSQNKGRDLIVSNLKSGKELRVPDVDSYTIDEKGNSLLVMKFDGGLHYISLSIENSVEIWNPSNALQSINNFSLDANGSQAVFTVKYSDKTYSIWYYKVELKKAVEIVNNQTLSFDNALVLKGAASFTDNGYYVLFNLQPKPEILQPMEDAVQLDVWSSEDKDFQTTQKFLINQSISLSALISIDNNKIISLATPSEKFYLIKNDFAIIKKANKTVYGDRFWEKDYNKDSNWLVSLKDGNRRLLPAVGVLETLWFSPGGKYLIYFDADQGCHYFSCDLKTGQIKDISIGAPTGQFGYKDPYLRTDAKSWQPNVAGWIEDDAGLLVYDNYDIWQLDMTGKNKAVNVTNGYGLKHSTLLSLINSDRFGSNIPIVKKDRPLLLKAFNKKNKYNGFYQKKINSVEDPEEFFMGPCLITQSLHGLSSLIKNSGMQPLKALNTQVWIVLKQTATEAPNYFMTKDFKTFKQLSNLQPQKQYNWLTTELVSFRQLDGTLSQGILYKPHNFDPTKKYPVIVNFYTQLSERLYQFLAPQYIDCPSFFDEPSWLVSHGYLVFLPDIYFTQNKWGPSVVNTIDGAAHYLRTLPYVDGSRLGACGHSNSGRFAYYLLTHSNSFAAMSVGAGSTNAISSALRLRTEGYTMTWGSILEVFEKTATGASLGNLWQNKESWLDHSPVINADKVTSPLLMFHNKSDAAFAAGQALEMYISLRRLEKPVWWLQYDQGSHILTQLKDQKDFTIRYTQFFDHYLKCAPAPRWMTQGIPNKLKGIEARYELDAAGSCALNKEDPGPKPINATPRQMKDWQQKLAAYKNNHCHICHAWNQQYTRTPTMFQKEIKDWALDKDIKAELDKKTTTERARLDKEGLVEQKKIVDIPRWRECSRSSFK